MAFRFKGGAKVPHHKESTALKPIDKMGIPDELVIPISQHIGAPSRVEVKIKDEVKKGQIIASQSGFVSSNIHAPTSGTISKVTVKPHPVLGKCEAIVLKPDGQDQWLDGVIKERNWEELSPDEIVETIAEAGIVGMGGAAFPTHVKLSPPKDTKIDTVLINGAECEPYLTSDHLAMRERTADLISGTKLIMKAINAPKAVIGVEQNKQDVIVKLNIELRSDKNISVVSLPTLYPQGAERSLIHAVLGRRLRAGKLPMDVHVVVQNANTALAIFDAASKSCPVIEKIVTVTGPTINEPKNVKALIGTKFSDLIEFCGGFKTIVHKVLMGGPMMGIAQYTLEVPVIKGTSGVLCFHEKEARLPESQACIRCGRCVDVCPMGLTPSAIARFTEFHDYSRAQRAHVLDCVECGCCSYECPSHRPLMQTIRLAKYVARKTMGGK